MIDGALEPRQFPPLSPLPHAKAFTAFCIVITLAIAFAGCLSEPSTSGPLDAEPGGVHVPAPSEGDTYRYEADSKRDVWLNLTVAGVATRADPWLERRPALVVNTTWRPGPEFQPEGFRFETAIDLGSGTIVSQWARCGTAIRNGSETYFSCWDERAMWVGASHRLPGGFGASPLWNETVTPGSVGVVGSSLLPGNDNWTYAAASEAGLPGECLEVRPEGVERDSVRALGFSGGSGPLVVCEGLSFPIQFTGMDGTTYRLVDHDRSRRPPVTETSGYAEPSREPPVPLVERTPPLFVEHPERETPFTVAEAHDVARERSDVWASFFDRHPDAIVVETRFSEQGGYEGGVLGGSGTKYQRRLEAVAPDGETALVRLQKTVHNGSKVSEDRSTYSLEEEGRGQASSSVPIASSLAPTQANVTEAIELAENLTGRPLDDMGWGLWSTLPDQAWMGGDNLLRRDGYTTIARMEDPSDYRGDGPAISNPYDVVVDGPTGLLLWVQADRGRIDEVFRSDEGPPALS